LSNNENAVSLLKANQDKINWDWLSGNPNAISLLEQNQDKIDWSLLSRNKNAISLLEQNQDKINWILLSTNPSIFQLDYKKMAKNNEPFLEELNEIVFNPDRIARLSKLYDFNFKDWVDMMQ
jgi:hypothetical protein